METAQPEAGRTRHLSKPPRLLRLDAKAAVAAIPGVSRLPLGGPGDGDVPALELVLEGTKVRPEHLAKYRRLCGYPPSEELPVTFPHVLAFPLHLALLTHSEFPFPAVGLVHNENRITRRRAIGVDETLELRVRLTGLEPHPRGQSFEIVTDAAADGKPVWQERCTIIRRTESGGSGNGASESDDQGEADVADRWRVPRSTGFRYAVVSGDHNPIHVHWLPARLSGLPGVVAPGMWTKARALASMPLPDAMTAEVDFRRPMVLPADVVLTTREDDGRRSFAVRGADGDEPYAIGTVESD